MLNETEIQQLLERMTVDEKIGQLVQLTGSFFDNDENVITGPIGKIGIEKQKIKYTGSILNTLGAEKITNIQRNYLKQDRLGIPLIFMADIINGFKTIFPIPLALGCSFDPKLVKSTAQVAAQEAAVSGVHVTFSPMVDMVRDARWGRVMESFGEDTYLNNLFSQAMVEGYQGRNDRNLNIVSCVKHFAAYGAAIAGRDYNSVELSERALRQDYLPAYKAAVDAGCGLVMTSFNTIDGVPATANDYLLDQILRQEWGFDGVVISDYAAIKELIAHGVAKNEKEATRLSLNAGCDIDMMTSSYSNSLHQLLGEGTINESQLDKSVLRVLELKNKLGLFDNPYRNASQELEKELILCDEFRKIARDAVTKTCVLLKNDNILPLNKHSQFALVGPYAQNNNISGMWSFNVDKSQVVTVEEGIKQYVDNFKTVKGSPLIDDLHFLESLGAHGSQAEILNENAKDLLNEALQTVEDVDTVIVAIGEHPHQSGEGGSRGQLTLPQSQLELLRKLKMKRKKVITLLFSGRPLELSEVVQNSDAIIQCWFPGVEGGNGIADLLFGYANPSAKLAMTFPHSVGQCPIYYNHLNTGRPAIESSHSTRFTSRYIDIQNEPEFCFGYGLSYSQFKYSKVELDKKVMTKNETITASIKIENTSDRDGVETVQLYIRDLVGTVARPVKELKGVQKVYLQSKETKEVEFKITNDMLKFVQKDFSYDSEDGEFLVFIGGSSSIDNDIVFELIK